MEQVPIPFAFARDRLELTWPEVAWGFRSGWFGAAGVVEYAVSRLAEDTDASPAAVELAAITDSGFAEVSSLIERVVTGAKADDPSVTERKWLYLILAWVYEHRADLDDPLGVVEQLYADFGYPAELRGFVRYMPSEGGYEPQAHTQAENVDRLLRKWNEYLGSFAVER